MDDLMWDRQLSEAARKIVERERAMTERNDADTAPPMARPGLLARAQVVWLDVLAGYRHLSSRAAGIHPAQRVGDPDALAGPPHRAAGEWAFYIGTWLTGALPTLLLMAMIAVLAWVATWE